MINKVPTNDMIVDSIVALLMQAESGVSGIRMSACFHDHKHDDKDEMNKNDILVQDLIRKLMMDRYGEEELAAEWRRRGAPVFKDLLDVVEFLGRSECELG